jgi:hypothetical protein
MCRSMIVSGMVVMAAVSWAQTQVATVTSSARFILRDASISPNTGVPAWPVLAGDVVKAGDAPTMVTYPDGSTITLTRASQARVDLINGKPTFQLVSGTAKYSLRSVMSVQLMTANQAVAAASLSGTLTLAGGAVAATALSTAGVVAVVAVVGAATAGIAVGVTRSVSGGAAASPSQ